MDNNVEKVMQKLRNEMRQMSSNLVQARDHSIRKSVSIMENQIVRNNEAFESHLKEVSDKHKKEVEAKIQLYENTIKQLRDHLLDKDNELDQLKGRLDECRTTRKEALTELTETRKYYSDRVKELENCIAESKEKLLLLEKERERRKSEKSKLHEVEDQLGVKQEEIRKLENKLEVIENELKEKQYTIEQLEGVKQRLEGAMETLEKENLSLNKKLTNYMEMCNAHVESDDSVRKVLEEQLAKIQKDWDETKKLLVIEQLRCEKLDADMKGLHKENGLLKVDLRIEARQKKELETKLQSKESDLSQLSGKNSALEETNTFLASKLMSFESEVESLKAQIEAKTKEHSTVLALHDGLVEHKTQLECDNTTLRNELALLKVRAKEYENLPNVVASKDGIINEKMEIIEQKNRKIRSLENSVDVLKEASSVLDAQLRQFEGVLDKKLEELHEAEKFKEMLEDDNRELREQLKKCRIDLNEAKSLKTFTEKRLEITESNLKSQSQSKETEFHAMQEKLTLATRRNEELSAEVTSLMTSVSKLESEKFELRKNLESSRSEKDRLVKEMSVIMKTVLDTKEENMSLKSALKETLTKAELYKEKFESCQEKFNMLEQSKNTNELMLNTQLEQQEKLIDFLRQQLAVFQEKKKKKGLFTPKRHEKDVYTPSKTGTPLTRYGYPPYPPTTPITPLCLEQEQLTLKKLEEKRANLRSQLEYLHKNGTPVSRKTPTLPPPKKEDCILLKERSNTIAGDTGKGGLGKPHKYHETRCERTEKCMVCRDPIYKGRPISNCEHCKYMFHLACAATGSKTCGLSEKTAYEMEKTISSQRAEPIRDEIDDDILKGWVKVRTENMAAPEKRYLKIAGSTLDLYLSENCRGNPVESFPLNEKTKVFFRLEKKDENKSSTKDEIAFAMKVSFYADDDDQQPDVIYMFHRNKNQKRYWTRGILKYSKMRCTSSAENTLSSDSSFCDENKENQPMKIIEKLLLEDDRQEKLYVNCIYWLATSQVYLLGCDDGLYSLKNIGSKPVKIEGPQSVHQIDVLGAAKSAVFIEGAKQALTTVYLGLLKTCAEAAECSLPKFTSQHVPQTKDCYIFAARSNSIKDTIVAAASGNNLLLCSWTDDGLKVVKQLFVRDSITTLLMTEHTVLFGNHNVYEVDTKTYELEEFLDMSDESVYFVKILNESYGSYPMAILDVTECRGLKGEPEYLVCFQDIGIFVDSFGRRSRDEDILWSKVPVSIEYRHPFLFVFHFTCIEIQQLDQKSYTRISTLSRIGPKSGENQNNKVLAKSRGIIPASRFFPVNSKSSPNYVGKGNGPTGVVFSLIEGHSTKVLELAAS